MTHYPILLHHYFVSPWSFYINPSSLTLGYRQQYSQTLHTLERFFSQREVFFWWSFGLNHLCRVSLGYMANSRAVVSWRRQVKKIRSAAPVLGLCQPQRAWISLKRARFPCLSLIWFFVLISIFHCNFILLRLIFTNNTVKVSLAQASL